jgi:parallel beta-helix repeat protein
MKRVISNLIIFLASAGLVIGIVLPFIEFNYTMRIETDFDFEYHNIPGSGTLEDPYIIENLVFGVNRDVVKKLYIGLEIISTTKCFVIRNCIFFGGLTSIQITDIAPGTAKIHDNTFYYLSQAATDYNTGAGGISIINSDNILIEKNEFFHCLDLCKYKFSSSPVIGGIGISNSENTIVRENTLTPGTIHIKNSLNTTLGENFVESSSNFCEITNSPNSTLVNNICFTSKVGFLIFYSSNILIENNTIKPITDSLSMGIYIWGCSKFSILNNSIVGYPSVYTSEYGIILQSSNYSIVANNIIKNFHDYGLFIVHASFNNTIYHNMFHNNGFYERSNSQGYDEGTGNTWYNHSISQGNYWDDLGSNSTYMIDGIANSTDLYPLSTPLL